MAFSQRSRNDTTLRKRLVVCLLPGFVPSLRHVPFQVGVQFGQLKTSVSHKQVNNIVDKLGIAIFLLRADIAAEVEESGTLLAYHFRNVFRCFGVAETVCGERKLVEQNSSNNSGVSQDAP